MDKMYVKQEQVFLNGEPLYRASKKQLIKLAMDLLRFPNVNHVEIREITEGTAHE